jgi:hypothetical protein
LGGEIPMTYTLHRANRYTHGKIVAVALSFAAATMIAGMTARSSDVLMVEGDGASQLSERKLNVPPQAAETHAPSRIDRGQSYRAASSKGDRLAVKSSEPSGERIARNIIGINTTLVAKTLPAAEQPVRHSTPPAGLIPRFPAPPERKLIACELAFSPFTTVDAREVYGRCFARLLFIAAQDSA